MGVNCLIFNGVTNSSSLYKTAGAYRIATDLRNAGYTVQVIDLADELTFNFKYRAVLRKFVDKDTLWIGFSSNFLSYMLDIPKFSCEEEKQEAYRRNPQLGQELKNMMDFSRSLNPNIKFVMGGSHQTFGVEEYGFYMFKGYADDIIVDFTDRCARDQEIDKKVFINKEYKDFHSCNIVFQKNDIFNNEMVLPIEISRGCIFKCKFCSFPLNGKKKFDYVRDYSVLTDEFLRNYDLFGVKNYAFVDDTYNDSIIKIKSLYDNVYSKLPFQIKFSTYLRLDLLMRFPDMVKILADSGLISCTFGIETLCPDNAKVIGKGINPQEQIEFLHKLKDVYWKPYNITMDSGFILGLPYDNRKKIEATREWLNSDNNPLDLWGVNSLSLSNFDSVINQSEFSLNYKDYGYTLRYNDKKRLVWDHIDMDMTYEEIEEIEKLIIQERKNSKRTKWAGFIVETQINLHKDVDHVLNNTIHSLRENDPHYNLEKEYKKNYFRNLMQLELPNEK